MAAFPFKVQLKQQFWRMCLYRMQAQGHAQGLWAELNTMTNEGMYEPRHGDAPEQCQIEFAARLGLETLCLQSPNCGRVDHIVHRAGGRTEHDDELGPCK